MFIIQNALKSITRNKLRNILIGIIVLVIAVSSCVALSIREAAETTKAETLSNMTVTAQISFDRSNAMKEMAEGETPEKPDNSEGGFDRGKFDFESLGSSLTLDDYMTYTEALNEGDSYYYSSAISLNASGDLLPYGTEENSDDDAEKTTTQSSDPMAPQGGQQSMMGGGMEQNGRGIMMQNQGDFAITGYSSYDAILSLFGEDGTCSITEGEMFDEESGNLSCIISDELAMYNNLSAGDEITLCNPDYEDETYTLTITGIYTNSSSSSEEMNRFSMNDPANNVYMNYNSVKSIENASAETDNKTTNDNSEEESAVINSTLAFTYTFDSVENYESFSEEVYDLGLEEDYTVTSSDITAFENSLTPLETLSTTAMWFFIIVLIVGGIILVTLNIFNLRERKYEVGVLTAIGMKKTKVAFQFLVEIFIVTFIAIIIGTGVGASVSVPVTNSLLESQITSSRQSSDNLSERFGFGGKNMQGGNSGQSPDGNRMGNAPDMSERFNKMAGNVDYVDSVSSATNLIVILQLVAVGLFLTIVSSLAAMISIMRYEPLKILSSRT